MYITLEWSLLCQVTLGHANFVVSSTYHFLLALSWDRPFGQSAHGRSLDGFRSLLRLESEGTDNRWFHNVAIIQFLARLVANAADVHLLQLSYKSLTERSSHLVADSSSGEPSEQDGKV
jgi:hypothetical protein